MRWSIGHIGTGLKTALLGGTLLLHGLPAAHAITIEEAIGLAISTNPDIGIAASNREAVDQELRQARGLYLPQIDVSGALGLNRINDSTTRGAGTGDDSTTNTQQELLLTVQQRIFDGFEAGSTVEREMSRVESAANIVRENAEVLALAAVGAYLEVLRGRELVRLARLNLDVHLEILTSLEERLALGGGDRADVSQTQVRVARARATLTSNYNTLRDAEADYTRIVGQFPDTLGMPEVPVDALPGEIDTAVDWARRNNLTTKIFEADVRTAESEVDLSEVPFWPTLSLEGTSQYADGLDALNTYELNNQILFRVRWNLFRGGIDRAARQEALSRLNESKNRRLQSRLNSEQEMRRFWFAWEASQQSVIDLERAVEFSTVTRDAYLQQFEVAQRTLLDVLDAENELFVSSSELVTAQTNEALAGYSMLAVGGRLTSTLGVAAPTQAVVAHKSWQEGLLDP